MVITADPLIKGYIHRNDEDQSTAHFGIKVSQLLEYYRSIEMQATTINIIRYFPCNQFFYILSTG